MKAQFKGRTVDILPAAAGRFGASDPARHEGEAPEAEESDAPAHSATKAEWVDYAMSQGADRAEAEGKTKAALIEEHGA